MKQQILVVDDSKLNIKVLEDMLIPEGYDVATALSGQQALEAVGKSLPDLILLDILMPDISGYEVFRRLKGKDGTKDIPVIFISALSATKERIRGLKMGAKDFIIKPFAKEEVLLRVKNCLGLIKTEEALQRTVESQVLLLDHIDTMLWYMEDEETFGKVNQSFANFFNRTKEALENSRLVDLLDDQEYRRVLENNDQVFKTKRKTREKHHITNGLGKKRMLAVTKTPKVDKWGAVEYIICSAEDITERNKKAEKLKHLTFHDSLTNLYNRAYYEEELKRLNVVRNLPLSVITCDVNGLKLANDIFGHHIGDGLLKEAANALREATREDDITARWGGDEFVVLLPNTSEEDARGVARRIGELTKDRAVGQIPLNLATGVATKERVDQDAKEVIKRAEDRMYRNKTEAKDDEDNLLLQRFIMTFYGKEYRDMQHSSDLTQTGKWMGKALNLDEKEQKRLELLVKFHDIGKISLAKEVLNKNDVLTDEEWEQYKNHVEIGYRIANSFRAIGSIAEEILYHHERYDGKGYPGKLQGKEIPLFARAMAVLDFYDGLRSDIYYPLDQHHYFKKGISHRNAAEELQKRSGTYFDPEMVQLFIKKVLPQI